MHVFATNIILWLRTLVKETIEALEEAEETMGEGAAKHRGKMVRTGEPWPKLGHLLNETFFSPCANELA
jgi:hypothetical protein